MTRPKIARERSLSQLARFLGLEAQLLGQGDLKITGVSSDSRAVEVGDLFIALPGQTSHGSAFLATALERGARAVLTDLQGAQVASSVAASLPRFVVPKPRSICGAVASWFYGEPSKNMFVAGITGTNGKTTTSHLLHQIWSYANYKSGLIGTVGIQIGELKLEATHTTPESDELQRLLALMKEEQARGVAMEVSSHSLVQERVRSIDFAAVGFTNLTQDHLDYHGDMERYFQAKRALFNHDYSNFAAISIDSEYGRRLWGEITLEKESVSTNSRADWHLERIQEIEAGRGYELLIRGPHGVSIENQFKLAGTYNLENLLIAIAIATRSGIDPLVIAASLPELSGAPGRLQRVAAPDFTALVDYAHTPDAVTRALQAVRTGGVNRVIAILGCGGDRDASKRPLMGKALKSGADISIFTSDNPRNEDPEKILDEMTSAVSIDNQSEIVPDRRAAIRRAVQLASAGDVVILLGKGHETGQEIKGQKIPFSDIDELRAAIEAIS